MDRYYNVVLANIKRLKKILCYISLHSLISTIALRHCKPNINSNNLTFRMVYLHFTIRNTACTLKHQSQIFLQILIMNILFFIISKLILKTNLFSSGFLCSQNHKTRNPQEKNTDPNT